MKAYLITGFPGSGKTAVGSALQDMGYRVIHGDEELVSRDAKGWNWDVGKLDRRLTGTGPFFVCGGADNMAEFLPRFRKIFVLEVPTAIIQKRLTARGNAPAKLDLRPIPGKTFRIEGDKSIRAVIHQILHSL